MKIHFRPLKRDDFPLFIKWLAKPHVSRWWKEPATMEHVETKYAPAVDGHDKTAMFIVEDDDRPVGFIQSYWIDDYPEHAASVRVKAAIGVDLFIGEEDRIGKGFGPALLKAFITDVISSKYPDARRVVADPSVDNLASIRAFEKAGFYKGEITRDDDGPEQLMIIDLD
ncbi:MAG TPA: GNAT family N-acetyltransferase [Candidatus Saccharimonadales bacterium]|nr:GNAT family N-acetyltransferase [Candidatus Saccharimonadales bacterium]